MSFTLYIYPINHLSRSSLENIFSKYGSIYDLYIPRRHETKKRRNFCYIKYTEKEDAEKAIEELNNKNINGKEIHVEWSKCEKKSPEQMEERNKKYRERSIIKRAEAEDDDTPRKRSKTDTRGKTVFETYFTITNYPPGVGLKYIPEDQRDQKLFSFQKKFFTYFSIPDDVMAELTKEAEIIKAGGYSAFAGFDDYADDDDAPNGM